MMKTIEIGKAFEEQAKEVLEREGYKIKRWFSKENWTAPCDMLVEKEGEEMYCEVRGVTKRLSSIIFSAQKMANLEALAEHTPVILFLVRWGKHKIVRLEDLPKERYVAYPKKKNSSNYYRLLEHLKIKRQIKGSSFRTTKLSDAEWEKVQLAKAEMGAKSNVDCILKFVDEHNELRRIKGRDII